MKKNLSNDISIQQICAESEIKTYLQISDGPASVIVKVSSCRWQVSDAEKQVHFKMTDTHRL